MTTVHGPRAVEEGKWSRLQEAANRVFRPAGDRDLFADYPLLFAPGNRENLRVLVAGDGQLLAHAGFVVREVTVYRRRIRVACIGAVFTAADHRQQGLATRVLADAMALARKGTDLVMASGDRGLLRRQQLEPIPPLARFRLPPAPAGAAASRQHGGGSAGAGITVRAQRPEDLEVMSAIYDVEDVHFDRPLADWRRLLGGGLLLDAPAAPWIVCRDDRPVAYLVVQHAGKRSDGSMRPRRALEVAGDREAVMRAAPLVADEILIPRYDGATAALAEKARCVRTTRQFLMTAEALTTSVVVIPWYGLNYI